MDFDDWYVKDLNFSTAPCGAVLMLIALPIEPMIKPRVLLTDFQPGNLGVDSLSFNWSQENCKLVPPVYLILRVCTSFSRCFVRPVLAFGYVLPFLAFCCGLLTCPG